MRAVWLALLVVFAFSVAHAAPATTPAASAHDLATAALQSVLTEQHPKKKGYALVWDGNRYIQCVKSTKGRLRCEAAGSLMQPSLAQSMDTDQLKTLGWRLDHKFGNYVHTFDADTTPSDVAEQLVATLAKAYHADTTQLEVRASWVAKERCPPRHGFSQNLAGMVDDSPEMAASSVHACAFEPTDFDAPATVSLDDLHSQYDASIATQLRRLQAAPPGQRVFVIFGTDMGYVQCEPEPDIYCEAQSAQSWPALTAVLTPDRVARLHQLGFADPGRAPNFGKAYPLNTFDADATAREIVTVLHDVYGYAGAPMLEVTTETGPPPLDISPLVHRKRKAGGQPAAD